jgi:hypothetical protein
MMQACELASFFVESKAPDRTPGALPGDVGLSELRK